MKSRARIALMLLTTLLGLRATTHLASACCPAPPSGKPVVNADQTVIILWDAETKIEHFIRRASFKSESDDFGFLVPTPNQPQLDESGNEAFTFLGKLTEPEIRKVARPSEGMGCGCSEAPMAASMPSGATVSVLEEKTVAGFHAVVLETHSPVALVEWLKSHGYAFSPEVEDWAKPYVEAGWKITALQVAKSDASKGKKEVTASALRMSFKTDRPLFPYREPDYKASAQNLGAYDRLLRIYFLGESRYQGELGQSAPWTGRPVWANPVSEADRMKAMDLLKLPQNTGPGHCWLTEFEDRWPYKVAPADLYFSLSPDQGMLKRPPIIQYVSAKGNGDLPTFALGVAVVVIAPRLMRSRRVGRMQ